MEANRILMGKDEREAILANRLDEKIKKAKGEVCRFDCGTGTIILGRFIFGEPFFWVEGDEFGTYVVKGNRFLNVSGGEIRRAATPEKTIKTPNKKEKKMTKEMVKEDKKKTVVLPKGGETVKHLGYDGKEEELNAIQYCNKIICKCGNIRYVKNADMFQVKMCKPCVSALRKKKIGDLKKLKDAKKKESAKSVDTKAKSEAPKATPKATPKAADSKTKKPAAKKPAVKKVAKG